MPPRHNDELAPLLRQAEALATRRRERLSTAHVLLAIASESSVASALLGSHRLTPARIEAVVDAAEDESKEVDRLIANARELAARTKASFTGPHHVLLALLGERRCAAYGAIERCGADPARIRMAAMQLAIGVVTPRRVPQSDPPPPKHQTMPVKTTSRATHAVAVSIVPKPKTKSTIPPPPPVDEPREAPLPKPARAPKQERAVERFALDPKRFPVLTALGHNLTLAASRGEGPPVIGRDAEIERSLDVLAKKRGNNPVLVGPSGVGKSATLRGIAAAFAEAPAGSLDDRVLVEIVVAELASGVRGVVGERLGSIQKEIAAAEGRVVLALDDLHAFFSGDVDAEAGAELRAALARREIPCVGATTVDDYRRIVEADPVLAKCFTAIAMDEPSEVEAIPIVRAAADALGAHHHVRYSDETLGSAVAWSVRYMPGRALPDKAIAVLDLAGARARRRSRRDVDPSLVASVVAEMTEVPEERLLASDGERMLALESVLAESVVGHGPMLARIAAVLRRNAAGIRGRRPIGTFLLLGPTGVGKTETAKAVAKALFHSPDAITRLDMSEYAEGHAIARLIGAPPGYVGHESGGQLTEAVRRRPYQVLLLDEIEKAHRDVLEAFLQVLDEGRMTDGRGRTVDFTNTVVLMTSNLGAHVAVAAPTKAIGFRARLAEETSARAGDDAVVQAAREALPPELYNRIDEVLAYRPLARDDVREIARRLLRDLGASLEASRGVELVFDDAVLDALLAAGGYDPELGARPMKRAIAKHVEAKLAELLLRGDLGEGDVARVSVSPAGDIVVSAPSLEVATA